MLLSVLSLALCLCFLSTTDANLVTFSNISQSGQGPGDSNRPYGQPTINGNSLKFTGPNAFSATSGFGDANMVDSFTDGFLSFSVTADDDTWITGFSMKESGLKNLLDLGGVGTNSTLVKVIAAGQIRVTELDHGNTNLTAAAAMPIDIGFDETFDLIAHPGASFWNGSDVENLDGFTHRVTAFDFLLDNQLIAFSESGTLAFIDKKRIEFDVTTQMVPEATSFLLFASAIGMTCIRRKRTA